ncbi:MAG: heavy metal-binding domain-containing protein [Deltaproteobacteria bacterium]|jgi:uncharacterized protein YbjQ (UPF0145 family)|nr:heavy metal-binding domain-containing protein [Deltaproteobacteria bacterium]
MSKFCISCGVNISPLTGAMEQNPAKLEQLRRWNINVPEPLCVSCFSNCLAQAENRYGPDFVYTEDPSPEFLAQLRQQISQIKIFTFNPFNEEGAYKGLGLVSGYTTIGTGFLTELVSAFTDFMGDDSKIYNDKMTQAEASCLLKLKTRAHALGANAVIGLSVSFTELTAGHGMLMLGMIGTAVTTE